MALKVWDVDGIKLWVPSGYNLGVEMSDCPVCLEPSTSILPCGHFLCSKCRPQLQKSECPLCRAPIQNMVRDPYSETQANEWKAHQLTLRDFQLDREFSINELYDIYDIFEEISEGSSQIPDIDDRFLLRLRSGELTWANPKPNQTTYKSEFDRLTAQDATYAKWKRYLPVQVRELDLIAKAGFLIMLSFFKRPKRVSKYVYPIPDLVLFIGIQNQNLASFDRGYFASLPLRNVNTGRKVSIRRN